MTKLGKLSIQGFGPFSPKHTNVLDLADRGLILIAGKNHDSPGFANSNGVGKSHIPGALSWVLFGKTVDGDQYNEVINHQGSYAEVSQEILTDDSPGYLVVRKRTKRDTFLDIFGLDDLKTPLPDLKTLIDKQAKIDEILGMNGNTFHNTVVYGQGEIEHFISRPDAEQKKIIRRILDCEIYTLARERIKKRAKQLRLNYDGHESDLRVFESQIVTLRAGIRDIREREEQWAKEIGKTVERYQSEIHRLTHEISDARKEIQGEQKFRDRLEEIKQKLEGMEELREKREFLNNQIFDLKNAKAEIVRAGKVVLGRAEEMAVRVDRIKKRKICPECGAPSESEVVQKHIKEIETEAQGLRDEGGKFLKKVTKANEGILYAEESLREVEDLLDAGSGLQAEFNRVKDDLAGIQIVKEGIGSKEKQIDNHEASIVDRREKAPPFAAQIEAAKGRLEQAQVKFQQVESAMKEVSTELPYLDFWDRGFGPEGVQSYLFSSALPKINDRASHYLGILSGGTLGVILNSQTTLKKGDTRERISADMSIEGTENTRPSGGQMRRLSLATDLALMDLVANRGSSAIDCLLLDEILDGLDEMGKIRIMDLLDDLRKARGSIFVISHDPGIQEQFENVVLVEKRDSLSRIVA